MLVQQTGKKAVIADNIRPLSKTTQEEHSKPLLDTFTLRELFPRPFVTSEVNNSEWKFCTILIIQFILILSSLPDVFMAPRK